jgi:signal transduction histidine kinase
MAVTALVVTLVLTNFYRRRTKRNLNVITQQKREIESTHTELEKAHQALKEAQSKIIAQEKYLQAKSIAGGFAHEIRNTLFPAEGAIHNLTGLLSKSGVTDTRIDLSINALKTATARAIQLTEVISNYTKLETPLPAGRIPIIQVISSVLERNAAPIESIGVKIVTDGDETCRIAANIEHLQAIFNNLLVNALDALTNTANPCIVITWSENSRTIRVRFSDNGSGISADHIGKIFEPFYSTKPYKGTGLGLSIVKKIVELYDGNITVSSEIGKGTVFEIELKANNNANVSD